MQGGGLKGVASANRILHIHFHTGHFEMRAVGLKATGAVGSACNKDELCAVVKTIGYKLIFAVFTE